MTIKALKVLLSDVVNIPGKVEVSDVVFFLLLISIVTITVFVVLLSNNLYPTFLLLLLFFFFLIVALLTLLICVLGLLWLQTYSIPALLYTSKHKWGEIVRVFSIICTYLCVEPVSTSDNVENLNVVWQCVIKPLSIGFIFFFVLAYMDFAREYILQCMYSFVSSGSSIPTNLFQISKIEICNASNLIQSLFEFLFDRPDIWIPTKLYILYLTFRNQRNWLRYIHIWLLL